MAVSYGKVDRIDWIGPWTFEVSGCGITGTAHEGCSAIIHRDGEPDVHVQNPPEGATITQVGTVALVQNA